MLKKIKQNRGALVVEASIVFPVTFLVVFLILYMGNAYLQKAKVEAIIVKATIDGAARCADPMMSHIKETGQVPALGTVDIMPYRYVTALGNGMSKIEEDVMEEIKKKIGEMDTGLFIGMKPQGYESVVVDYKTIFIASTLETQIAYKIYLPMRWLGESENLYMNVSAHYSVPVGDTPEFIRNVNMVEDYMEVTGLKGKIDEITDKVSDFFKSEEK